MRSVLVSLFTLAMATMAPAQMTTTQKTGEVPPLNVQVNVGTQQRNAPNSFYRKNMNIQGKVTLEGPSRMLPIPELEATLLVVTMDTRAKYQQRREEFKVHSKETIDIPAAKDGSRRQFSFAESSVSFDGWRDNSNVGGEIYKYYVFALKEKSSGTIIDFKTNNVPFASFLKSNPARRDELLALSQGAPFPAKME